MSSDLDKERERAAYEQAAVVVRQLTNHVVEGDSVNHQLIIEVLDEPTAAGACHNYRIRWDRCGLPVYEPIIFQNGPIKEAGINGVTHEALLAILIDRLAGFQRGPFACAANEYALSCCKAALAHLQARTLERIGRGVEGTHQK